MNYFSIAPAIIYDQVDWLDEEISLSQVTVPFLEEKHIEFIKEISLFENVLEPEPSTVRVQTEEFGSRMKDIHNYFAKLNGKTSERGFTSVLVLIKNFYITKNQIVVRSEDEIFALYEMNRANERYLFGDKYFESVDWSNIKKVRQRENALVMASAGSPNWGHFLVDEIPRICLFIGTIPMSEEINIYFTEYNHYSGQFNKNRFEAIELLFPDRRVKCHLI